MRDIAARQSKTTQRREVPWNQSEPYVGPMTQITAGLGKATQGHQCIGIRRAFVGSAALERWGHRELRGDDFLLSANLGKDGGTTATIIGQLAGALFGATGSDVDADHLWESVPIVRFPNGQMNNPPKLWLLSCAHLKERA